MVHGVIHILVAATLPPLLLGVIAKTKAAFAGRVGAPVLQPYYDLAKLFRKGSVFSTTTTWVFRAGPVVGLAIVGLAVLLIPLGGHGSVLSFTGDFILLAYLLAWGASSRLLPHWTPARPSRGWEPHARSPSPAWRSRRSSSACWCWPGSPAR